jgi:hypothetical protein
MMVLIEYNSNNSGGSFWLSDEDWINLEKAGWKVRWVWEDWVWNEETEDYVIGEDGLPKKERALDYNGEPKEIGKTFCGTRAMYAVKDFKSINDAIKEFEKITGQDANAIGCLCCGPPHNFYEFQN